MDTDILKHRSAYVIEKMDCPTEESIIRKCLRGVPGVEDLQFDLFNRRLTVTHRLADDAAIVKALQRVGMDPARLAPQKTASASKSGTSDDGPVWPEVERQTDAPIETAAGATRGAPVASRRELILLGVSGTFAFAAEVVAWTSEAEAFWPVLLLSATAILCGGIPILRKGLIALRTFALNINFLMTLAVFGAFAIGEYPEAAVVVFLFAVAELIEKHSLERARHAVRSLMDMAPDTALVKQQDGSWRETPAAETPAGSTVRVKPGERLALDGVVVSGNSAVDQSPITGESVPVDKAPGDQVFAGTINQSGVLEFSTTGGKDETTLARIIRSVQEAQGSRAPTQRFVDQFARVYTPVVCVLALLVAVVPWGAFGEPFLPWLYRALVLLVIACPCALVISTPVTIVSGLTAAARRGILIKGGVYLEQGRLLKVFAMDKTGTITEGRPRLVEVIPAGGRQREEVLQIAASLNALSDHPVARAVVEGWQGDLLRVDDFQSLTGRGVTGRIGETTYYIGSHRLARELDVSSPEVEAELTTFESQGNTAVVVADSQRALGVLAVADTPRETSVKAVQQLHELGLTTAMLSGDNQITTEAIARIVGIDDARGELLPEDKLSAIDEIRRQQGIAGVGMVGDGVNDAPALAKASIGFAMGAAGTDTALETADVALMRDDLRGVPEFIRLSRRTSAVLKQNITLAIFTKAIFFGLALAGLASLWMAIIADLGASLAVIFNGLRLLRHKSHDA